LPSRTAHHLRSRGSEALAIAAPGKFSISLGVPPTIT
jgi:hypothetical protein